MARSAAERSGVPGSGGECLQHGNRLRISQRSKSADRGALDVFLFVVYVHDQELAHGLFLFFVASEVSNGAESLSITAAGVGVLMFGEVFKERREVSRIVL